MALQCDSDRGHTKPPILPGVTTGNWLPKFPLLCMFPKF